MMGRLLCTLAFVIVSAVPGSALSARPANLTPLLERLAVERNVHIAFSHMLTDPVVVRDPSSEGDVPAVLERWLEGTDLQFKHLGENYYIYKGYRQDTLPGVSAAPVSMPAPAFDPLPVVAPVPLPQSVQRRFYESLRAASVPLPAPHSSFRPVRLEPVPIFRPAAALSTPGSGYLPAWAVKTNLLYDATRTLNLGVEFGLARRWTLDVSGNYNPWTFSENRKMKHWLVQPEVRWWSCTRFSGHFMGLHALGGGYNWGGMLPWGIRPGAGLRGHRYQGWLVGAGVSYGYHWVLGNRWGLEATVGAGYAYLDYDKYPCAKCGRKIGRETQHYFGPTKAGITLIFMVK